MQSDVAESEKEDCEKMSEKLNILYVCPDAELGGSTRSLFALIETVKDYVNPIVLLPVKSAAYEYFVEHGIECVVRKYEPLFMQYHTWGDVILHPWHARPMKLIRFNMTCAMFMLKYLRGRKIDIVHTNYSLATMGETLASLLHAKHVWHIREYGQVHFGFEIYGGEKRLSRKLNNADARIAISTALKEYWHLKDEKTWVILNAVRSSADACYCKTKEKYFLFISGSLMDAKGTRDAVVAFAQSGVAKNGYMLKLIGACTEEYRRSLDETIREYRVADSVEYVPLQKDVKPYLEKATGYIMASKFEGMGRTTAEAMFYGCPVIAHASGGTLDMVIEGETGYLFETVDECAAKIQKVCAEPQEQVIHNAQQFAVENLSKEQYGERIMNVYKSLMQ